MKELDTSSVDAMHWAECLEDRINSGCTPDAGFLVGWFANYWGAAISPYERKLEAAEAREAELQRAADNALSILVGRFADAVPVRDVAGATMGNIGDLCNYFKQSMRERDELRARVAELEATVKRVGDTANYFDRLHWKVESRFVCERICAALYQPLPAAPKEEV